MPDYVYLLENRLSADQQRALRLLREAARESGTILFLTGDAVRDLTSGHSVHDLEVSVHEDALKFKTWLEERGAAIWGEDKVSRSLYLCFPGTVRVDLLTTHHVEYPKPGTPVYRRGSIQEQLRHRDFTVNAMAISLNEGSFGLLMDPLNGAADIEGRILRLVSNYGFLEEPSLLIRATRYQARLGWELDPKTLSRYNDAKEQGVIEYLSPQARSRELEQIGHEEECLKVLRALDAEGWMKVLFAPWTPAKADEEKLKTLRELALDLLLEGIHADMSAAQMRLLTAGLAPKDLAALKKLMLRPGFVEEWNSLDALAAGFAKALLAPENAVPSANFKLFTSYDPEAILWLGFTSKDQAVKEHFQRFLKLWPETRQRIPHALMQEMRITAELPAYPEIVRSIFLELIDGRLTTVEEARAFLEPHSPPAPPPQVAIKRPRGKRGAEAKLKEAAFDDDEESEDGLDEDEDLDDIGGDDDGDLGVHLPKIDADAEFPAESESTEDGEEEEEEDESEGPLETVPPAKARAADRPKASSAVALREPEKAATAALKLQKAKSSGKPHPAPEKPHSVSEKPHPASEKPNPAKIEPKSAPRAASPASAKSAPAAAVKSPAPASGGKHSAVKPVPARAPKPGAKTKPAAKAVPAKTSAKMPAKMPAKAAGKSVARKPLPQSLKSAPTKKKTVPASTAKGHKPMRPAASKAGRKHS